MKNNITEKNDITRIQAFYKRSNADIVSALDGEGEGILFTLPPNSPDALRRAVRQLRRAKATRMQWIRRLRLSSRSQGILDAVGIYIRPDGDQRVYRLDTGAEFPCEPISDICLEIVLQEMSA
jgi:hypothetical protein